MGSLCIETKKRADGTVSETWRVLVGGGRRPRHTIRLGRVSKRIAETAKLHIDVLEEAAIYATAVPAATLAWLASLRDDIHARIVRAGLAEPRERHLRIRPLMEKRDGDSGLPARKRRA